MTVMSAIQWLEHYWIIVVVVMFLLLLASTYWPGRKQKIERHGHIPLEDDR